MNGVLDIQTSGNDWSNRNQAMLHERLQDAPPTNGVFKRNQRSLISNLEAQMSEFEAAYQASLAQVRKLYVVPADSFLLDFLGSHRFLPQLLIDAAPHLQKYFADTVFSLRAMSDEYGWENLYADAAWAGEACEAISRLDRFEDEWWIANCRPARGALTFTYRLV